MTHQFLNHRDVGPAAHEVEVERAAACSHLLVTGGPGAGKSSCLHDFVQRQLDRGSDLVLLSVDQLSGDTLAELSRDLGLSSQCSVLDALEHWAGDGLAYLVIDGLDAARTRVGFQLLVNLLKGVQGRAGRWRIVASIREFDLEHSPDIKRLFRGSPHPTRSNPRLDGVCHLDIGLLDQPEFAQVRHQAPALARLIDGSAHELQELLRNPFNLRLACELIADAVDLSRLSRVSTQIGLLELYWQERVEKYDQSGVRELLVQAAVERMVQTRTLQTPRAPLYEVHPAARETLRHLLSEGVFAEQHGILAGSAQSVAFSHNILFDYAVARIWLQDLPSTMISTLAQAQNQDLLLAIRPSLVFAFQRLWHAQDNHGQFWDRGLAVQATAEMRLIGKIIASTAAAAEYRTLDDVTWLLDQLAAPEGPGSTLLRHMITAAISQHEQAPQAHPLSGAGGAPEWLRLAAELSQRRIEYSAWEVYRLLVHLEESHAALPPDQAMQAGLAARNLLRYALSGDRHRNLVPCAISVVGLTIESAPAESAQALRLCLEPQERASGT